MKTDLIDSLTSIQDRLDDWLDTKSWAKVFLLVYAGEGQAFTIKYINDKLDYKKNHIWNILDSFVLEKVVLKTIKTDAKGQPTSYRINLDYPNLEHYVAKACRTLGLNHKFN